MSKSSLQQGTTAKERLREKAQTLYGNTQVAETQQTDVKTTAKDRLRARASMFSAGEEKTSDLLKYAGGVQQRQNYDYAQPDALQAAWNKEHKSTIDLSQSFYEPTTEEVLASLKKNDEAPEKTGDNAKGISDFVPENTSMIPTAEQLVKEKYPSANSIQTNLPKRSAEDNNKPDTSVYTKPKDGYVYDEATGFQLPTTKEVLSSAGNELKSDIGSGILGGIHQGIDMTATSFSGFLNSTFGYVANKLGWKENPWSAFDKFLREEASANTQKYADQMNTSESKAVNTLTSTITYAVPYTIMAFLTQGENVMGDVSRLLSAPQSATYAGNLLQTIASATNQMLKDPNFWTSYIMTSGQSYDDALEMGCNENQAKAYSVLNGFLGSIVEVGGGGIQNIPEALSSKSILKAILSSGLEEATEEPTQGIIERSLQNIVLGANNPIASVTNEKAILNPVTAAKESSLAFITGALMAGASSIIAATAEYRDVYKNVLDADYDEIRATYETMDSSLRAAYARGDTQSVMDVTEQMSLYTNKLRTILTQNNWKAEDGEVDTILSSLDSIDEYVTNARNNAYYVSQTESQPDTSRGSWNSQEGSWSDAQENIPVQDRITGYQNTAEDTSSVIPSYTGLASPSAEVQTQERETTPAVKTYTSDADIAANKNIMENSAAALGENGGKALTHFYDGKTDPAAYFSEFSKLYEAGRAGKQMESVSSGTALRANQKLAAWASGKKDLGVANEPSEAYNLSAGISAEKGMNNNGAAALSAGRGNSLSGNGGRDAGLYSGQQGGRLETRAGTPEKQGPGGTQAERAAQIRASEEVQRTVRQSSRDLGLESGTDAKITRVLPNSAETSDMRSFRAARRKNGVTVTYIVGNMEATDGTETFLVRGAISADGKHIWLRVDHPKVSWQKLARHELYHAASIRDASLNGRLKEQIIRHTKTSAGIDYLMDAYTSVYFTDRDGKVTASESDILEEVFADTYAGIDILSGRDSAYVRATDYTDIAESAVNENPSSGSGQDHDKESFSGKLQEDENEEQRGTEKDEDRRSFLRRSDEGARESGEVGGTAYSFKRAGIYDTSRSAEQAGEELKKLGIKSFFHDGLEYNENGKTHIVHGDATAIGNSVVGIYRKAFGSGKEFAGHEAYHIWGGSEARGKYDEVFRNNLNSLSLYAVKQANAVAEQYFGNDVINKSLFVEEFYARITGLIHGGEHDAELRTMFRDYDAVKAAWENLADSHRVSDKAKEKTRFSKDGAKEKTVDAKFDRKLDEAVVSRFGKTYNWNLTGYIQKDGTRIDLSGVRQGSLGNSREEDHREVWDAYDAIGASDNMESTDSMIDYMSRGNIRIMPEANGINLSVLPTDAQEEMLSRYITRMNGEIVLDIDDLSGNTLSSTEYPKGTRSGRIIGDIRKYFKDGEAPSVSDISRFRYSRSAEAEFLDSEEDKQYLDAVNSGDTETAQKMVDEAAKKAGYSSKISNFYETFYLLPEITPSNMHPTKIQQAAYEAGRKYGSNYREFLEENPDLYERIFVDDESGINERFALCGARNGTPEYRLAIRYGEIPKTKVSTNWGTGERERGVSAVDFLSSKSQKGKTIYDTIYGIQDTKKYIIGGWDFGIFGSDGEPLIVDPVNVCTFADIWKIKKGDPVTYDDNGNVILLSERFNSKSGDIRYSREKEIPTGPEAYKGKSLSGDSDVYSYEFLTAQPDMTVTELPEVPSVRDEDGSIDTGKVVSEGLKNARSVGTVRDGKAYVKNSYTGRELRIDASSIRHSMDGKLNRMLTNSRLGAVIGEIVRNAIPVNALTNKDEGATGTYAMAGLASDSHGRQFVSVVTVEQRTGNVDGVDFYDVAHSVSGRQQKSSRADTKSMSISSAEAASVGTGQSGTKPQGVYPIKAGSSISISNLLSVVKGTHQSLLSADVLDHFGEERNPGGFYAGRTKFSRLGQDPVAAENEALREKLDYWKGQTKRTFDPTVRQADVDKLCRRLIRDYDSTLSSSDISGDIKALGEYMMNSPELSFSEVKDRAMSVASDIVQNASALINSEDAQTYRSIISHLKNTKISFADNGDIPDFNEFRKKNFGRFIISESGIPIDSVWEELQEEFGYAYFPQEIENPADQLTHLSELLDSLKPIYDNPHSYYISEVQEYVADDIIDSLIGDVRQTPPTYADLQAKKLDTLKAKDREKLEELREQKNRKISDAIASGRAYAQVVYQRERARRIQQVSKLREHYRTKEYLARMDRKSSDLREKILRHTDELARKLLNPTDTKHIPYKLTSVVANVLQSINQESSTLINGFPTKRTRAFAELKKTLGDISGEVIVDPDFLPGGTDTGILDEVISMSDVKLEDMTYQQLSSVWSALRSVEAMIRSANKVFGRAKYQTISEAAEGLWEDNSGKKPSKQYRGIVGSAQQLSTTDMMTPETFFHYLGDTGDGIFRSYRNAQDRYTTIVRDVRNSMKDIIGASSILNMEKTMHTVTLGGEEVQMSTAQLMELYVLMRRKQAIDHIIAGGILPDEANLKGIKKVSRAEPVRGVSYEEISRALAVLSPEEIRIAEGLQDFASTTLSGYGNEASLEVYGYKKFTEPFYWPIRVNKQEVYSEIDKEFYQPSVAHFGMTKPTVPNAKNSVRIGSIFDTFTKHTAQMATYAAYLGTEQDINRIRNFTFKDGSGNTVGTVKGILDRVHGAGRGNAYLTKLMTDVANGVQGPMDPSVNMSGALLANYKAAAVGLNLRVIIQQPTAILRALDMIDFKYFLSAVGKTGGWKKAVEYAPIAQWKDWGYFDINTGRQLKDILFGNDKFTNRVKEWSMIGAEAADSVSWGFLWNACEYEISEKQKDLKQDSPEFYAAVSKRFTEIVDHTQVVDGILQRSQFMRSPETLKKMSASFMGEPTKQYNMMLSASYDYNHARTREGRERAKQRLSRTALAMLLAGVVNAAVQSVSDAERDKDQETSYWENFLKAFIGISPDNDTFGEKLKSVLESNVGDMLNPMTYIPYAKDIISIIEGYDVKRMDMEGISDTVDAATKLFQAFTTGKYTVVSALYNLMSESSRLLGIPLSNLSKEITSLASMLAIKSNNYALQYRMYRVMYKLVDSDGKMVSSNKSMYIDLLHSSFTNDPMAYKLIYEDMIKNGVSVNDIRSGIDERLKADSGVQSVDDLDQRYLSPSEQMKWNNAQNSVSRETAWKNATDEQRDSFNDRLYDYVVQNSAGQKLNSDIEEAKKAGVSEYDYLLWLMGKSTIKSTENETKQEQIKDFLMDMDLTSEEREFLWDSLFSSDYPG